MDKWLKTGSFGKRTISKVTIDESEPGPSNTNLINSENGKVQVNAKKPKTFFRKYSTDYIKYGFTFVGTEEEPLPQCVICFETLANQSMKPSKRERHISTKHPEYVNKHVAFFENKKRDLISTRTSMENVSTGRENKKVTMVSYQLSLLIAKKGAPHTAGENIILPAAKLISASLFDEKATKKIMEIPLSNNTVKRRIEEMAENIKRQLISALKRSDFYSLQLDESTDIADNANLLAFVRFETNESVEEEMLFCRPLPTTTTGADIFNCLDGFMKENEIDWSKCVGVTTDGARAMSGIYSGLAAKVKAVSPLVEWVHCSIHREALAVKGMGKNLKNTLDDSVKIVNLIKSQPKNSRVFGVLCDEMGSEHKQLLMHCEVRWLSRGKVLVRLFELRDEVRYFLSQLQAEGKLKAQVFSDNCLNDEIWLIKLAYLADIFSSLNTLNLTLQGKDVHKFFVQDKVHATIKKIQRWSDKVQKNIFDAFPLLNDFLDENDLKVNEETSKTIFDHLEALASNLRRYFLPIEEKKQWIKNPFDEDNLKNLNLMTSQDTSPGQEVLDTVFRHLNLLETSYFGLRYLDSANQTHWLDTTKKVTKQLKGKDTFTLYFGVKFYAADPCKLLEEITRYQFFLQIKQDILQGRLPVSFELAAELGAFVVQSELGDYDPRRHSPGYVSEFRFLSNQTVELENKISELHKDLQGQLPSVAELNYLDKVKWMEMYGVDLHPVLGEDNVEYFLGLTPTGVIVLRNKNKVANYYWPRITKIYFKGRYFMLRVCDKNNDENTYGFETPSKPACKHLYKCCVEHHAFFRLVQVSPNPPDIIGTRFNSGRAEKISQREAQMRLRSPPQFTRTPSRRYQRRIVEGAQDSPKTEENLNNENIPPQEMKTVSIPQPVNSVSSLYRGNVSVGSRCDSPRSTRSAPWSVPHARGLYTGSSPRSLRSAGHTRSLAARRSSSVESHSSNDSRSCKKHRHHRSRRGSDNESDLSRCSGGKSRRHRHRSRRSSGSEHETRHRPAGSKHRYELVDSESQWKEVQRKQAEGSTGIQQATVISSSKEQQSRPRSGYMNSGMETESEHSYHHRRKHRKHRSRSRSPSEGKSRLPEELKQHLEFKLVETEGMSDTQLREIPYKVVETTAAKAVRVRLSPTSKRRTHSARRAKSCMLKEEPPSTGDSPPPPYSETPSAALTDVLNKNSTTQLPRVSNTQTRFNSGNVANRTMCSALYGNPSTLLGNANLPPSGAGHNGNASPHRRESVDNSSWLNGEYSQNNKISSNSTLGLSSRKSDLPPRPFPFSSMRVSQNNHSTNHGKTWTTPEVRGAVGLPWPTIVDGLYTQSPSNSHLAFNTLPENYASRYNTPDSLKYPSNSSINNHQQYPEQTRPNLNSSHDFLQQVHAATSYLNSYSGTPVHSRSYAKAFIENTNGNTSYDGGTRQNSNRSNWNKDSERSNSVHSSGSSETCLSRTQSSDNFQNRTSEVSNSGAYNKVQGSLFDSPKIVNHLGKPVEETMHSPNRNQSEEKSDVWRETDRGPLYYQKGNEHQQQSSLPISHTQSANSMRTEVNNNPRILHEMSTEL